MLILIKKEVDDFRSEVGVACEQLYTEIIQLWIKGSLILLIPAYWLQQTDIKLKSVKAGGSLFLCSLISFCIVCIPT